MNVLSCEYDEYEMLMCFLHCDDDVPTVLMPSMFRVLVLYDVLCHEILHEIPR